MQLDQAIAQRQSVREFNGQKTSKDELSQILNAAICAPQTMINKGTHISVISDAALLNELNDIGVAKFGEKLGVKSALYGAPTLILASAKLCENAPEGWGVGAEVFNRNLYWSMGSLIQNMHLKAVDLGLGACPINTIVVALFEHPELAKRAGIPEGYSPLCALAVGKSSHKYATREPNQDHFVINFID